MAKRLCAQIEVPGRIWIAIGGLGSECESPFGISLLEEKLRKVCEGPVIVGMVIFDKLDRRQKMTDRFLVLSASFIAQAEVVISLVRSWIHLQNALELADRVIHPAFLVVDPAEHVSAFLVVGMPVQELDKPAFRRVYFAEKIFCTSFDLHRREVVGLFVQDAFCFPFGVGEALRHQIHICQGEPP